MRLTDLRTDRRLLNAIDWDMTPEEAIRLYLEWGCNWARSNYVIRSKNDVSHYFVVNTWKERPVIYLIRRNSEQADELAVIEPPDELAVEFMNSIGHHKGVYALSKNLKKWLRTQLHYEA